GGPSACDVAWEEGRRLDRHPSRLLPGFAVPACPAGLHPYPVLRVQRLSNEHVAADLVPSPVLVCRVRLPAVAVEAPALWSPHVSVLPATGVGSAHKAQP